MKKFKVPGDATVSGTIWNSLNTLTKALKEQTTNELSIKTWVSDEDSDTVTSGNTDKELSQEIDTEPSATPTIGPS